MKPELSISSGDSSSVQTVKLSYTPVFKYANEIENGPRIRKKGNKLLSLFGSLQMYLMIFLTVQQIILPIIVRVAKRRGSNFIPTALVFVTELLKLLMCSVILIVQQRSVSKFFQVSYQNVVKNFIDTLRTCVPAFIYAIQNNLYYIALQHINAAEYTATYQLRILTTALLSVFMLKKSISNVQWLALFSLLIGVLLVQLPQAAPGKQNASPSDGVFAVGITAVIAMCWTSAFAGVYFEMVLKKSALNLWMENLRLGLMTLVFSTITMLASDSVRIQEGGLFQGWDALVWIVVILSAVGGLIVSAVMKYADNVKKTFCQSVAIASTSLLAVIMNDAQATSALFSGVILVVLSTYVYATEPSKPERPKVTNNGVTEETKTLVQ